MAKDYKIAKTDALCIACGAQLPGGTDIVAVVREREGEFVREDFCPGCWQTREQTPDPDRYGIWRTHVPMPQEKKKLLVDDPLLINFFQRLADAEDPVKIGFRFVLALVLMRKKLLIYDGSTTADDGRDVWKMHFKATGEEHQVIDPKFDEDKIAQVSQSLGEIIEADL